MLFNSGTNSIVAEIDQLCDSDSTSYTTANKTRRVNTAYEILVGKILNADGYWEFDDTVASDLPIATAALVEGQESYTLPARSTSVPGAADLDNYLYIIAVEILNSDGNIYRRIRPLDHTMLDGLSPDEYFGVLSDGSPATGAPEFYDKIGDTLFLYPAPTSTAATLAAGLKIYYQRTPTLFTTSDTTAQPGIAQPYHILLAYMTALPYCVANKPIMVDFLEKEIIRLTEEMIGFYSRRQKDERHRMVMRPAGHYPRDIRSRGSFR